MVKLKLIKRNDVVVLRISEGKERFYKSAKSLLVGNPNISKHWVDAKEQFSGYAINHKENNKAIKDFKASYQSIINENPLLSARQVATYYDKQTVAVNPKKTLSQFISTVVNREMAKGTGNYKYYKSLLSTCRRDIYNFDSITFSQINFDFCVQIATYFAKSKSYMARWVRLNAIFTKADKDPDVNFKLKQIGDFKYKNYAPDKNIVQKKSAPTVLTTEELNSFLNLDLKMFLSSSRRNKKIWGLYYDIACCIFYSFLSPCDLIKLKKTDIDENGMIYTVRKKTHKSLSFPMATPLKCILYKYIKSTKGSYIFPILKDDMSEIEKTTKTHIFSTNLHVAVKEMGEFLNIATHIHPYIFRHTAITTALNNGLPLAYVASIAGTSIQMIQNHYYNSDSPDNHEKLTTLFESCSK